jgi:hypothetical protein
MKKSIFCVLSVAAVMGAVLTSTAASAAVTANARASGLAAGVPASGDPDTTVTFTVTSGLLTMTAPATADLGSGAPGTTITGALGTTVVTDNRALLAATWTALASSTDFTTGTATTAETIPVADAFYDPGVITTTGTITATGTGITLSGTPEPVVRGTAGTGDNTASWDPTIAVTVPASAVVGTYTGTLTQSVS